MLIMFRRINVSAAVIVLICFFLPWLQVSCAGAHDSLTGFQLARDESTLLWLVPILMLAVIAFNLLRAWKEESRVAAILSVVCGAVTALLMNRERMRANDTDTVISAQLTGWFWLSLFSSVAIVASSFGWLLRRRRPEN
jgi:CDP-diglyceride synthetase